MASNGINSLLWFIAIIVMIPLALWLFKRSPAGARFVGTGAQAPMRSVGVLALSASQRVVTVEVGQGEARRWLVLGVTPQSITTLHTLEPQADAPADAGTPAPGFAQLLAKFGQHKRQAGAR
jgi:flagellar protein FliO/FliZ